MAYIDELRKDIVFNAELRGFPFSFHTTWGIFSPREIDEGTRLLLDYLKVEEEDDCLDIGCGYGPIGMVMASLAPAGQTWMVDRDFTAVEYAQKNIEVNRIGNCRALLSNGYDQLPKTQTYDVVASNIPAKVGKEMLHILLHDTVSRLNPGGRFYVVTVNGLRKFMQRNFQDFFGNYKKLKQGAHYTVAMAVKE